MKQAVLNIEYQLLQRHAPRGIFVDPDDNKELWHGVYICQAGLYEGGFFRFEIEFPDDYP